ncbi:MAG: hypothetical protein JSV03_00780 [Planctomycetota bacterium]|nr:MAG: hypothetical protein JSV03_00780 [Planctomycetota bacterium]
MASGTFATAISCMDGRTIIPVTEWMKKQFKVDYVDMITEAGPDKTLSQGTAEQIAAIRQKVAISINKHNSRVMAIVGHHDCAANPVDKETHFQQIKDCCAIIKIWELMIRTLGVWLNEKWDAEVIDDTADQP